MKMDIENKILIPFLILVILPIIILGIVSYWGGYQILVNNQIESYTTRLNDIVSFIDILNEQVEKDFITREDAKTKIINHSQIVGKKDLFIIEGNKLVFDNFNNKTYLPKELINKITEKKEGTIKNKDIIVILDNYNKWDWIIGYKVAKNKFTEDLLGIQKYTLLVAIIFLIFSVESTILVAHNISKPIRSLADRCNNISLGNFKGKIHIQRRDEIGILANAFNNMLDKLQNSTDKLIEMKKFNEDILRNISTGIITTDKEGNIKLINEAATKILGYKVKWPNKSDYIIKTLLNQLKTTIDTQRTIHNMYDFKKENKSKMYLDVTTSLLKTEEGYINGAICNFNDITERKKIENRMERMNRLASLGQLAAGLAHEIRNPLAGMKTSVQVLKNRLKKTVSESTLELFSGILYEIDRLNNLITELLDFAKPHFPKCEVVNIMEILKRALDLTRKAMDEKSIKTDIMVKATDLIVFVDKAQIEQVFLNIITNAVRAMDLQGTLNIIIDDHYDQKNDFLIIEFRDNGCGINQENIEKIFDPFFTTDSQGTGLGLSVVHNLIAENNGEIEVESSVGVGTSFKIKLPMSVGGLYEEKNTYNR
jgi:PAS domain S-box-containing protein